MKNSENLVAVKRDTIKSSLVFCIQKINKIISEA